MTTYARVLSYSSRVALASSRIVGAIASPCVLAGRLWYFRGMDTDTTEGFRKWLFRRGKADSTADAYCYQVSRGIDLDRLVDRESAPKYLHSIRAAYKAFARFTKDDDLLEELEEISLPPAMRVHEKEALTKEEWLTLIDEIDSADYISEPVRSVLGMMACRGFRRGDVLRLRRVDISKGLNQGILTYEAKGRRRLSFPINDHWGSYLETLVETKFDRVCDAVAPGSESGSSHDSAGSAVSRALEICAAEVGLEGVHPHLLRKTYATQFYLACEDPVKLKDHMQWANIQTAMLYVAKSDQKELEAVADSLFE